jgi:hypothetical protein
LLLAESLFPEAKDLKIFTYEKNIKFKLYIVVLQRKHINSKFFASLPVAFPRNFFISREAATAERRYEKERQSVNYVHTAVFSPRTRVFSPLLALPLPLSHPPQINAIRGAGLRLFPPTPPPPHTP